MKFMNKKEQVIDFQLTQYGKRRLSQGKLKPAYYSFFDDNILYDSRYLDSANTEDQNDIENRIQNLTPQLETQYNFQGLETRYEAQLKLIEDDYKIAHGAELGTDERSAANEVKIATFSSNLDRLYYYNKSLGTTSLNSTKTPSFKIDFFNLETITVDQQLTKTTDGTPASSTTNIPQIDITIANKIKTTPGEEDEVMETDTLLAEFLETNVNFDIENFEIEVFKKKDESGDYVPLLFKKDINQSLIKNGILMDRNPNELTAPVDENYVEYYFKINVDSEIPNSEIHRHVGEEKVQNILTDDPSRKIVYGAPSVNSVSIYSGDGSFPDDFCEEE